MRRSRQGFTLIELLIVIFIICLLAGIVLANYAKFRQQGRDTERVSDVGQIQTALEGYFQDPANNLAASVGGAPNQACTSSKNCYPVYPATLIVPPSASAFSCQIWPSSGSFESGLYCLSENYTSRGLSYIPTLPVDPSTKSTYFYYACSKTDTGCIDPNTTMPQQAYCLGADLENPNDQAQAVATGLQTCSSASSWCPYLSNYSGSQTPAPHNYVVCRQ